MAKFSSSRKEIITDVLPPPSLPSPFMEVSQAPPPQAPTPGSAALPAGQATQQPDPEVAEGTEDIAAIDDAIRLLQERKKALTE